jgi:hypothetical protein
VSILKQAIPSKNPDKILAYLNSSSGLRLKFENILPIKIKAVGFRHPAKNPKDIPAK